MKQREDNLIRLEEKKRMAEKKNNYARFVKEMHVPVVSKKKQLEMELIKEKVNIGGRGRPGQRAPGTAG